MLSHSGLTRKVAGMVTLYNSERVVEERIRTYIHQVGKLYVVDNSEQPDRVLIESILSRYPTAKYIGNSGNKGIAYALNRAAQAAIYDQFDCLLLMDDDSETPAGMVSTLCDIMYGASLPTNGIVSAQPDASVRRTDVQEVITTITSGSLLNLKAYQQAGPFLDELFIDWVDHEYSFRLRRYGYRVLIANQVRLKHRLGYQKCRRVLGLFTIKWQSHSPARIYYKFRNSRYVLKRYGKQVPLSFVTAVGLELVQDVIRILLVEDVKKQYLQFIRKAILDANQQRMGKLILP